MHRLSGMYTIQVGVVSLSTYILATQASSKGKHTFKGLAQQEGDEGVLELCQESVFTAAVAVGDKPVQQAGLVQVQGRQLPRSQACGSMSAASAYAQAQPSSDRLRLSSSSALSCAASQCADESCPSVGHVPP